VRIALNRPNRPNEKGQPCRADDMDRESGTATAIRHWLHRPGSALWCSLLLSYLAPGYAIYKSENMHALTSRKLNKLGPLTCCNTVSLRDRHKSKVYSCRGKHSNTITQILATLCQSEISSHILHAERSRSGTAAEAGMACKDAVRISINGQLRGVAAVACIVLLATRTLFEYPK